MQDLIKERKRLISIANESKFGDGFNGKLINYRYLTLKPYFKGNSVLELGSAEGPMTKFLMDDFSRVVAVDGSSVYCDILKKTIKNDKLEVVCSMFEEYTTEERFDTIIMAHILEHVDNPIKIMSRAKRWLRKNGVILIDVPNANSLHRQAAVYMKLLKTVDELNKLDIKIGHRRVYTPETLTEDIIKAKLRISATGGVFIKLFTNAQIDKFCTLQMQNAFYELGKKYGDIAAEIYVVCTA